MGKSDQEVRAADQQRVGVAGGDGDVESRAVTIPRAPALRDEGEVDRESTRSVYRDLEGRRRIVGSGAVIPPGWTRVEGAPLQGRGDRTETAHPDEALGRDAGRKSRSKSSGSSGSSKSSGGSSKPTLEDLRQQASDLEIEGRSNMSRKQLTDAIAKAKADKDDGGGSSE